MFVHLHNHSNFSFLDSTIPVEQLVECACQHRMTSMALTDTNGLYAAVPFYKKAREAGLKPILGAELTDPQGTDRALLLAKSHHGYTELSALITRRQLAEDFDLAAELQHMSAELIILTDSIALLTALHGRPDLYAELVLTPTRRSLCRQLYNFARQHQIPLVATNDVHFASPEDYNTYRILRATAERATIHTVDPTRLVSPEQFFASPQEMAWRFRGLITPLRATLEIAEQCNVALPLGTWKFPPCVLPQGETPFSRLWKVTFDGLKTRYQPITQEVINRLKHELEIIDRLGFCEYFLVVHRIVEEARRRGFLLVGRGSAVNSIVSYSLGLTNVDPLRYNLYFERFLNPERSSPPDIDIDFSWKDRDELIQWVYDFFGQDKVALISTTVTMRARHAIRETAKALGIPESEVNEFTRPIPGYFTDHVDLRELPRVFPECQHLPMDREPWPAVLSHAQRILGFPRNLSIHCGGIVIAPEPITHFTPLQRAAKGFVVTQMDMFPIEELGLIKIDLLSQRSLGAMKDCLSAVRTNTGDDPPLDDFARITADPETRRLIRTGRTMGCFYIESPGMRALLERLECDTFEMLVAASSIIRPGVAESGMMRAFIDRHRDPAQITYLHPTLEPLLRETYGVMIYQEDVIRVAHELGGMSLGEADLLRRAMSGKMRSHEAMDGLEERFFATCRTQDIPEPIIREIWRQVASFAGYSFCKGHSAAFAVLSYQMAYLKAHYPAEFMAAVLSNEGGFYHAGAYIQEARRLGLRILLPCIRESEKDYVGRGQTIRIGLKAVKSLSEKSIATILDERAKRPFSSLHDFAARTRLSTPEIENLILVGAFDCLGQKRTALMLELARMGKHHERKQGDVSELVEPVRSDTSSFLHGQSVRLHPEVTFADYSLPKRCELEYEILGYMVSAHPLELITMPRGVTRACDMQQRLGRKIRMIGWAISSKLVCTKNNGRYMKFMSFEDLTGTFEATLFPRTYQRVAPLTLTHGPYLLEGRVENQTGTFSLVVEKLGLYNNNPQPSPIDTY
jgi:DNA-directed DNA polymerase III PolC